MWIVTFPVPLNERYKFSINDQSVIFEPGHANYRDISSFIQHAAPRSALPEKSTAKEPLAQDGRAICLIRFTKEVFLVWSGLSDFNISGVATILTGDQEVTGK